MNTGGRPPLPKDHLKSHRVQVRCTKEEQATMKATAKAAGLTLTDWMRERLLGAAKVVPDRGGPEEGGEGGEERGG